MSLWLCFKAERVKLRKGWPMLMALLAPFCQVGFLGLLTWYSEDRVMFFKPGFYYWIELNCIAWNLFFLPVTTALVSQLSWGLEDDFKLWNLLLVQPVARFEHFLAKFFSHFSLILVSLLILQLLLVPSGLILRKNEQLFMGPVLYPLLFKFLAYSLLSLFSLVAFHTWLSMRFSGLWISLVCALVGTWACVHWVGKSALVQLLPWGMSAQTVILYERWRTLPWGYFIGSLVMGTAWLALGIWGFSKRTEKAA